MSYLYHLPGLIIPKVAAEDLAAHRIVIIDPTTNENVRYPEADADTQLFGITLAAADSGKVVDVAVSGIVKCQVDGNAANLVWGDWIQAHSTAGLGMKVTSTGAARYEVIGRNFASHLATGASTADNDIISVQILPQTLYFAS